MEWLHFGADISHSNVKYTKRKRTFWLFEKSYNRCASVSVFFGSAVGMVEHCCCYSHIFAEFHCHNSHSSSRQEMKKKKPTRNVEIVWHSFSLKFEIAGQNEKRNGRWIHDSEQKNNAAFLSVAFVQGHRRKYFPNDMHAPISRWKNERNWSSCLPHMKKTVTAHTLPAKTKSQWIWTRRWRCNIKTNQHQQHTSNAYTRRKKKTKKISREWKQSERKASNNNGEKGTRGIPERQIGVQWAQISAVQFIMAKCDIKL